jgi:endonuclease/exonuclease/phosphatase family metal-dependent hydrolase
MGNTIKERALGKVSQLVLHHHDHEYKENQEIIKINLLTFNMFVRPPFINNNGDDFKDERIREFLKEMHKYDVICMQEMFSCYSKRQDFLLREARKAGFLFSATSPKLSRFSSYIIDGGLVILSKFPIISADFFTYSPGLGVDYYVQKGVLYAKVKIGNAVLHLFDSHTQANYADKLNCFLKKAEQLREFERFIHSTLIKHSYREGDLVILVGDLNVDALSKLHLDSEELALAPELQGSSLLDKQGVFSEYEALVCCLSNNHKEGLDDIIYKDNGNSHPITFGDCYTDENNNIIAKEVALTGKGGQCTNQSLDYIFQYTPKTLSKYYDTMKGLSDKASSRLSVVEGGSSVEKFLVEGHRFTQLSDHYGVKATLQYSQNI